LCEVSKEVVEKNQLYWLIINTDTKGFSFLRYLYSKNFTKKSLLLKLAASLN